MTIEEKAKAYDKVREKIAVRFGTNVAEEIFSEFEESEDERIRKEIIDFVKSRGGFKGDWIAWLEKQGETYTKKNIADLNEFVKEYSFNIPSDIYNLLPKEKQSTWINEIESAVRAGVQWHEKQGEQKPADTVEPKCEESKTKIFDAPTPFEDKLYAFVLACEILVDPSKREFILEHSQEILDAAREQIGKEQSSAWSKEDEKEYKYVLKFVDNILNNCGNKKDYEHCKRCYDWLKSLKTRYTWKPSDEQMAALKFVIESLDNMFTAIGYMDNYTKPLLEEILEALKKLREE